MRIKFTILSRLILFIVIFVSIYRNTFVWLYEKFTVPDSYYSHSFLVPLVTGFLIWKKRSILREIDFTPAPFGLFLLLLGLFFQLIASVAEIYFLSEFSLFLVIIGIVFYLFGKDIGKQILSPLLFLLFMFPIPMFMINAVAFPMKIFVTNATVFLLQRVGFPVMHDGFEIIFPADSLFVDTPCSGLRSLITFLALGFLFAYFLKSDTKRKSLLFLSAIPIAIFSNFLRVVALSLATYIYGSRVAIGGFFHDFSGFMVFVVGFILLVALRNKLECRGTRNDI